MIVLPGSILARQECVICQSQKTAANGTGYEYLIKCTTVSSTNILKMYADNLIDCYSKTQLSMYSVKEIIAKEFQYHRSCYRNITRPTKNKTDNESEKENDNKLREQCFEELKLFVKKHIIEDGQFIRISTLSSHYRDIQNSKGIAVKGDIVRNLKARLENEFGEEILYFQRKVGTPEIVYGNKSFLTY